MMFTKTSALVILTFCFFVEQSVQELCVPQSVVNINLYSNHILSWYINNNEPCEITEYHVYIFHPGQPAEYAFSLTTTSTDVSFLEVCEEWIFTVVPISGYYIGRERRLVETLPVPADADLSIAYLNVNHDVETSHTHLHWDLIDTRLGNCSLQYRVTIEVAESPIIEGFFVTTKFIDLRLLSSCTAYQFGVRAINTAFPPTEGPWRTAIHLLPGRRQHPPVLLDSEATTSTISMSFGLESLIRNPCDLRQLYIDGGSQLSQTIALSNEDRWSPVNVTITNLEPSTTYDLKVYVSNTAGWSNGTEVSITTLDL